MSGSVSYALHTVIYASYASCVSCVSCVSYASYVSCVCRVIICITNSHMRHMRHMCRVCPCVACTMYIRALYVPCVVCTRFWPLTLVTPSTMYEPLASVLAKQIVQQRCSIRLLLINSYFCWEHGQIDYATEGLHPSSPTAILLLLYCLKHGRPDHAAEKLQLPLSM